MFITHPAFHQPFPHGFYKPGHDTWRGVTLSLNMAWFLFTYRVEDDEFAVQQTSALAHVGVLTDFIAQIPEEDRIAAYAIAPTGDRALWQLHQIASIWKPGATEALSSGGPLLRLVGDDYLRDSDLLHRRPNTEGRNLIFRLHDSEPHQTGSAVAPKSGRQ